MTVKLLTEHHLEFLSLKRGSTGSSESTLVKTYDCWKSHVAAQMKHEVMHGLTHNVTNTTAASDFISYFGIQPLPFEFRKNSQ